MLNIFVVFCGDRKKKHFSIGSSRASLTRICAVPEVEIWRRIYCEE